jgi:hypothetical protein
LTCRFDAVPEERRKQLYDEFYGLLEEAGMLTATTAAAGAEATAAGAEAVQPVAMATAAELAAAVVAGAVPAVMEIADPGQLEWLRQEQSRLKEEYAK